MVPTEKRSRSDSADVPQRLNHPVTVTLRSESSSADTVVRRGTVPVDRTLPS